MTAPKSPALSAAKAWREVAPAHRREILKHLASLGDGYHFAGLLGMEAYVKLAIVELKRAAAETVDEAEEPMMGCDCRYGESCPACRR
jgi:hypothetical protein